jgi:3-deoxy-D-manno-octulosonic-acid transferase
MKSFVKGRKMVFDRLRSAIDNDDRTIWFHCASLGEFEQGVPVMDRIKKMYQDHKLVITFFSPSGYEVKKEDPIADVITYLPLDTPGNVRKFLKLVHPSFVVFVKNEIWPNYLFEIKKNDIPVVLISALFRKDQSFFKSSVHFMRKALFSFDHIFVQNQHSLELLKSIEYHKVTHSGDTRFDRVSKQLEQNNTLDFVSDFKQDSTCVVMGSTWPEDEKLYTDFVNGSSSNVKFIMAPHKIDRTKIDAFLKTVNKRSILYSEMDGKNLNEYDILIIDTIGLLTKAYSYANIAYVGGAMGKSGLHNILEAATFGIPIVIGKNFSKFPEALQLQHIGGLFSVKNSVEFSEIVSKLVMDNDFRNKTGMISGHYVNSNTGATDTILRYFEDLNQNLEQS